MVIGQDHRQDVARAAAEVAARAGMPEREPQIAYCLAVLITKRLHALAPGRDVGEQLREGGRAIAEQLAAWADLYDAIQADLDRRELTTIRRFIPVAPRDGDIVDAVGQRLSDILEGTPPTGEMTLALAYEEPPSGSAYVFQSPLPAWIRAATRAPHDTRPLDETLADAEHEDIAELIEQADALGERQLRDVVERVAEHLSTRELLASLIERADRFDVEIARMRPASRSHAELLVRLRAEIVATADQLVHEQRALRDMLAYVVLAMGGAVNVQAVAVASLRTVSIAPEAIAAMVALMRELLADELQPTPSLVQRTRAATGAGLKRARLTRLERLAAKPDERGALTAGITGLLDTLPAVVGDDMAAIAAALTPPSQPGIVKENRRQARIELGHVDRWLLRVFNRYTRVRDER